MTVVNLDELKTMDFTKQLTFAYLTCERLFPNYVYFSDNYNFGKPGVLREAIDYLYVSLFESNQDKNKIRLLTKEVERNTPDTEDYATIFVSSALDACTAISESLDFLIDKEFSRIRDVSTFATDTVDMYIQEIEALDFNKDKEFRKKIDNHPLMKNEVAIQSGIITFLNSKKSIDHGDIQTLLNLQGGNKKGSLGL